MSGEGGGGQQSHSSWQPIGHFYLRFVAYIVIWSLIQFNIHETEAKPSQNRGFSYKCQILIFEGKRNCL